MDTIVWLAFAVILTYSGDVHVINSDNVFKAKADCEAFIAPRFAAISENEQVLAYGLTCSEISVKRSGSSLVKPEGPSLPPPVTTDAKL